MRLWTIQPVSVYEQFVRDGVYTPDPAKMDEYWFPAYDWLCKHLESKIPRPSHCSYPVWAWQRISSQDGKKPDLRLNCWSTRGDKMVLLELDIPESEILSSCFHCWHSVLNNFWLDPELFINPDYNEETYDKNAAWFKSLSQEEQQREKEKSWLEIFNIEPFESDWIRRGYDIQAIFWELKLDHVKSVRFFTAK